METLHNKQYDATGRKIVYLPEEAKVEYMPLWDDLVAAARARASSDKEMLHLVEQLISHRDVHLSNENYTYRLYCQKLEQNKKLKKQIKSLKGL